MLRLGVNALSTQLVQVNSDSLIAAAGSSLVIRFKDSAIRRFLGEAREVRVSVS